MKLKDCLELGKECGLWTIKECVANVNIHSTNLFKYEDINKELGELNEDINKLVLSLPTTLGLELLNE